MKKNLLALVAVVFTLVLSSFTVASSLTAYFIYDGTGDQKARATNYSQQPSATEEENVGALTLNWFKITEADGVISDADFVREFEELDITNTNANLLDDESEQEDILDLK